MRLNVNHTCPACQKTNEISVGWISPLKFTDPTKATGQYTHWCQLCDALVKTTFKYGTNQTILSMKSIVVKPADGNSLPKTVWNRTSSSDTTEETYS